MRHPNRPRWVAITVILALLLLAGCSSPSAPQPAKQQVIVYVTATGHKYHRDGCRYLSRSKFAITLEDAKADGYGPCSVCNPPR
ncbi:MAG: hypothetical protein ACYC5Y_05285 [Symbiobacteriia bacterium]